MVIVRSSFFLASYCPSIILTFVLAVFDPVLCNLEIALVTFNADEVPAPCSWPRLRLFHCPL
jgi:hypothetical protein